MSYFRKEPVMPFDNESAEGGQTDMEPIIQSISLARKLLTAVIEQ